MKKRRRIVYYDTPSYPFPTFMVYFSLVKR